MSEADKQIEAAALLADHAAAVIALADALVERRTILGDEIDHLMNDLQPPRLVAPCAENA